MKNHFHRSPHLILDKTRRFSFHLPRFVKPLPIRYLLLISLLINLLFYVMHALDKSTRYHRCSLERIPYITNPLETAQYLLFTNNSLIRFGDAELQLMVGMRHRFQDVNDDLTSTLTHVFENSPRNVSLAIYDAFSGFPQQFKGGASNWNHQGYYRKWVLKHCDFNRQYFDSSISSPYAHNRGVNCILVPELYKTMREIWRGKDIVLLRGNKDVQYKYDVYDTARSQTVLYVPPVNAWNSYHELRDLLMGYPPDSLYILSAGPVAKALAFDLVHARRRALDLGRLAKDYNLFRQEKKVDNTFYSD